MTWNDVLQPRHSSRDAWLADMETSLGRWTFRFWSKQSNWCGCCLWNMWMRAVHLSLVGESQKDFYGKFGHDRRAYFKTSIINLL